MIEYLRIVEREIREKNQEVIIKDILIFMWFVLKSTRVVK